jgi:hypothetical protein
MNSERVNGAFAWGMFAVGAAILLGGCVAAMTGCSTADQKRIQDEIDRLKDETTPTTTTTTTTTTQPPVVIPPSLQGVQVFLWKPVSENNGRLVVITPACVLADSCTVGTEKGSAVGRHNGNREHFRFSKPGAQYGNGVTVISYWQGTETGRWTVPQGAARKEIAHACK